MHDVTGAPGARPGAVHVVTGAPWRRARCDGRAWGVVFDVIGAPGPPPGALGFAPERTEGQVKIITFNMKFCKTRLRADANGHTPTGYSRHTYLEIDWLMCGLSREWFLYPIIIENSRLIIGQEFIQ